MPGQALAAAAVLVSFAASGNRVDFKLDDGAAALTWYSPATFRFQRADLVGQPPSGGPLGTAGPPAGPNPQLTGSPPEKIDFTVAESADAVRIRSKILEVTIQKRGLLVSVSRIGGDLLMQDLTEPVAERGGGVIWCRAMPPGVRYYGVDSKNGLDFDFRGRATENASPLLISTAGYGEYHVDHAGGPIFDLTAAGRYSVRAQQVDYFFHYGPTPRRIFEERRLSGQMGPGGSVHVGVLADVGGGISDASAAERLNFRTSLGWERLQLKLMSLTHGAMYANDFSGVFDLDDWVKLPPDLQQRARQIGSLIPGVKRASVPLSDFRTQLNSFFNTYEYETTEKGLPLWHPLPFEFPDDPECAHHADEFMLGDEMLIAPIYTPSDKRSLYLPQGVWTNLETNEELQGRRTIEIETKGLPVFARNGTIVPLDAPAGMALHYFPKLAAEFFILEKDANAWTQLHAAPAVDAMRLEIESKVARDYEWVVHHVEKPSRVGFEDQKYAEASSRAALTDQGWFYDASQRNLHVRAQVSAGEDRVIQVSW